MIALAVAVALRMATGGTAAAASAPAAILFAAVLTGAAVVAGARPAHVPFGALALGLGGGAALVGTSLVGLPVVVFGPRAAAASLTWWVPLVALVAATEELVLRGVLFDAVRERGGDATAVACTAALFAVIHLPLYGTPSLAIDLCVGVFLGCLRVASGSVAAPMAAHILADVATGWIG